MKEYNILVFGSLPIATKIVKYINSIPNFNLLGVVSEMKILMIMILGQMSYV